MLNNFINRFLPNNKNQALVAGAISFLSSSQSKAIFNFVAPKLEEYIKPFINENNKSFQAGRFLTCTALFYCAHKLFNSQTKEENLKFVNNIKETFLEFLEDNKVKEFFYLFGLDKQFYSIFTKSASGVVPVEELKTVFRGISQEEIKNRNLEGSAIESIVNNIIEYSDNLIENLSSRETKNQIPNQTKNQANNKIKLDESTEQKLKQWRQNNFYIE